MQGADTTLPRDPTDEGDDLADVLVFRRDSRRRIGKGLCLHRRLSFDRHNRALWCRDCGADVDPFYAIERYGQRCLDDIRAVQAARGLGAKVDEFIRAGGRLTVSAKDVRGRIKIGGKESTKSMTASGTPIEAAIRDVVAVLMQRYRRWQRS